MVLENFMIWSQNFIGQFEYLAVFIIGVISNAGIFFQIPTPVAISLGIGFGLHPLLVGVSAGLGFGTGQMVGYLVGFGGEAVLQKYKRNPKWIKRLENLLKRFGFWFVLVYSALPVKPIPFDILGVLAGLSRYDIKKFYLAVTIGYVFISVVMSYGIFYGWEFLRNSV